jgi:hypothetical protein
MTFADRVIGAVKLDARTYEDIKADPGATRQAVAVMVLVGLAGGIVLGHGAGDLVTSLLGVHIGWVLWTWLIYFIGTRWYREPHTKADAGQVLRTVGFAASPSLLCVLGAIPGLRGLVFTATTIWTVAAEVVAVRQTLGYRSTVRAVGVCIVGWLVELVILFAFTWLALTILHLLARLAR